MVNFTKEELIELLEVVYKGDSEVMVNIYEKAIEEAEDRKDKRQANFFKENLKSIKETFQEIKKKSVLLKS